MVGNTIIIIGLFIAFIGFIFSVVETSEIKDCKPRTYIQQKHTLDVSKEFYRDGKKWIRKTRNEDGLLVYDFEELVEPKVKEPYTTKVEDEEKLKFECDGDNIIIKPVQKVTTKCPFVCTGLKK